MRKPFFMIVFVFVTLLFADKLFACEITFEQGEKVKAEAKKAKITAVVKWEHKKWVLAEDDVNIDYKGAIKIKESGWKKEKPGLFKNEIEVELTEKEGEVRVWRECSKKGVSEGKIKISE
ncbi:MAG: hypothetical protein N3B13_07725 [Deltaproteobacteria bacterium]|nr:hypothetical protein [Deltaproteobacteria bacterium]